MTVFNENQEKAITTLHKNILVSASAGSGKTTVLIERLLRRIRDKGLSVNEILAMTFTEAAASEMKNRLKAALSEVEASTNDEEIKQRMKKELSAIDNAYISTIHGFCLKIIKEYYYTISLDKSRASNIIDEATKQVFQEKCLRYALFKYIEKEEFVHLCKVIENRPESHDSINKIILDIVNMAQSKSDPEAYLIQLRNAKPISSIKELPKAIKDNFFGYLKLHATILLNYYEDILGEYSDDANINIILTNISTLKDAILQIEKEEYDAFIACIETVAQKGFARLPKGLKTTEKAKDIKTKITSTNNKILSLAYPETLPYETKKPSSLCDMYNRTLEDRSMLLTLSLEYMKQYNQIKEEYGCMDFDDLEHYALKILKANNGMVADIYRNRFKEIMVDEFQDSNDKQNTLVQLICKENNVFRVGDIKQSIYGFRHATPTIMKNLINNKGEYDEVIYLNNNYRSKTSIVNFNNELFKVLMNIDGFTKGFDDGDYALTGLDEQDSNNEKVQLHLIDTTEMNDKNDAVKAKYIARQIMLLRQSKNYNFKDFVVLIKANAKASFLRDAFEESRIPYFIQMKTGFYATIEISSIISFLEAIDNPKNEIAMISVLTSDFYRYSDEQIAQIKLEKGKISYHTYLQDELQGFKNIRELRNKEPLSVILKEIFKINGFYKTRLTPQQKCNVDKLYDIVCEQEKNEYVSVASFLQTLKSAKDADGGEAIPLGSNDDVVKVMSIHQSKGLQFPVVFLYSTDSISIQDTIGNVTMDSDIGIGLSCVDISSKTMYPSIEKIAIDHKINQDQLEEHMRVLYVALTRAQNELHIVDCGKEETYSIPRQADIYKKKGFTHWIYSVFNKPNELFDIQYIKDKIEPIINKDIEEPTPMIHMNYTKDYSSLSTLAPSENEIRVFRPRPYNPKEKKAMERGTNLHKVVELLPATIWDKEVLSNTATSHNIVLDDADYDILLALNTNPIWKESYNGEIHHELPFMIKKTNQIVHGYMDYVSILEDKIILIDFKSDRHITRQELIHRYYDQLKTYEDALSILYDKEIETFIYSFTLKDMIQIQ